MSTLPSAATVLELLQKYLVVSVSPPSSVYFSVLKIFIEGVARSKLYRLLLETELSVPDELPGLQLLYLQWKGNSNILAGDLPKAIQYYQRADNISANNALRNTVTAICSELTGYRLIEELGA